MTHEQADESRSNPLYLKDRKYRENCQSCVVAYEMRRRGYDVEAVEWDERNNLLQRKLAEDQRNGWTNEDGSPAMYEGRQKMSEVRDNWGKKVAETLTPKRAKAEIESLIGEGRYVIEYATKGMQTSGHIVMAERVGGKVRVFDPQSGKESSLEDEIKNHMKLQSSRARGGVKYNMHPKVMRVDNKVLRSDYGNEVLRKRTTPKKTDSNVERKEMLGRMFRRDPNMGWVLDD